MRKCSSRPDHPFHSNDPQLYRDRRTQTFFNFGIAGENPDDKSIEYTTRQTLQKIESSKHKKGRSRGRPSYLVLQADGSLPQDGNRFWTGDMLIYNNVSEARRMTLRTVNGVEYLAIENGNFPENAPKDWHPGYSFYLKRP